MKVFKIIACCISTLNILGQDAASEIVNINKAFYDKKELALEIESLAFKDDMQKPINVSKVTVYKTDEKYLFKTKTVESMANGKYKINVNHKSKTIIVAQITSKPPAGASTAELDKQGFRMKLDTIISYYKEVTTRSLDDNRNEMIFVFKKGNYEQIKIVYDKKTYMVFDYVIKLRTGAFDELEKEKHNYVYVIKNNYKADNFGKNVFSESNYVIIKKEHIAASSKYAGYQVINNTRKKV